jgi:DNA-binding CsgD family transcriptional regulator
MSMTARHGRTADDPANTSATAEPAIAERSRRLAAHEPTLAAAESPPISSTRPKETASACFAPAAIDNPSHVCAEFTLDCGRCQVVRLDGRSYDSAGVCTAGLHSAPLLGGEIARFEIKGQSYALLMRSFVRGRQRDTDTAAAARADFLQLLTQRELQIVQLICTGCLTKQVADRLHISEFTVRSYLKTIYCKLGVRSRGAMVYRYAQSLAIARTGMPQDSA